MNDTEKLLPQNLVTLNVDIASEQNIFILVSFHENFYESIIQCKTLKRTVDRP
jgi:hypothetical protein